MRAVIQKKGSKLHSLTLYIIFSITFVIIYSIVEFICSLKTRVSHDTLTTCVYAFFAGEVVTCGLIKIFKLKGEGNSNDIDGV